MAEEDSHNVVIQSESTSGSVPLVDAASNHINHLSALDGSSISDLTPKPSASLDASNSQATPASEDVSQPLASKAEAEPSAGNANGGANAAIDGLQELGQNNTEVATPLDVSADPSVGSDNEAGKADTTDAKDGAHHNRTNSVKRPATFSKVSVTKNFLAKSASATPVLVKVGDKSATAAMAAPMALKPRLVAKSAATLGNSSRSRNGAENSPAPDASTVWNKNRPAPTMPTKQFTDEELKQQYGIHLATRLQTDENGKGSKWADIDDDEDDWAPEAVVWMDGTKSSLAPAELPAEIILEKPVLSAPQVSDTPKPTLTAMKKAGGSSTVKTILKPGAAIQAKQLVGQDPSITLAEKQSLKAKSPATVPSKSPWAALPPVDKISPVNPPVQVQLRQPASFVSQDARVADNAVPAGLPAREIAADTFDRSWREGEGERRELFNSTNGRYEPAPEGRRNSIKHEPYGRKPAVLSRASGHAESQSRVNGTDGTLFSHRRGSSVSHGSGPSARRVSYSRGSDSVTVDNQAEPGHGVRTAPIGQQSPWQQQLPPPPPAGEEGEDPIKAQERVMREKIAAARQRRQEEEAHEEAAKQERLKAKLEALAGAGQSRKDRQTPIEPTVTQNTQAASTEQPQDSNVKSDLPTSGDVLTNEASQGTSGTTNKPTVSPSLLDAAAVNASPRLSTAEHLSPSTTSRATFQSQSSGSYRTAQTSTFSSPGDRDRKLQPFGRSPVVNHDTFSPWPSAGSSSNVWGVSGIGNGTFEGSSLFAPIGSSQQISSLPPPPGMNRATGSARISPQALDQASPNLQEAQLVEPRGLPTALGQRGGVPSQGLGRQHVPGPIGPPSRAQPQHQAVSGWQAAAHRLPNQFNVDPSESMPLDAPVEHRRNHIFKETFRPTTGLQGSLGGPRAYGDAEYSIHDAQGSRAVNAHAKPAPQIAQTHPTSDSASPLQEWKQSQSAVRLPDGSLNPAHGGRAQQLSPIGPPSPAVALSHTGAKPKFTTAPLAPALAISDNSPPPPETTSHPVHGGFAQHPHVRLPPAPPVVRLPPAQAMHMSPRQMQSWGPMGSNQPIVKNGEWQARFNGLFNRTPIQTEIPPSPPRTPPKALAPVMAVASSSRPVLDDAVIRATVSLPPANMRKDNLFTVDNGSTTTSKDMAELMFNEELGFGSRPRVRVPRTYQSPGIHNVVNRGLADPAVVEVESKRDLPVFHMFYKKPDGYFVKLTSSSRNKFVQDRKFNRKADKISKSRRDLPLAKKDVNTVGTASRKTTPRGVDALPNKSSTPSRKRSAHHKTTTKASSAAPTPVKAN